MANVPVGWWASDQPVPVARGRRITSSFRRPRAVAVSLDHLLKHFFVCGATGSGKTRLLRRVAMSHIAAGRGFTLIDPAGDLTRELLAYLTELAFGPGPVTKEKVEQLGDKVVLLEIHDHSRGVPGVNVLQVSEDQIPYTVVDSIIEVVREIWSDFYGPRLEDIVRNLSLLAIEHNLTFVELLLLLQNAALRDALVAQSRQPELRDFFKSHLGGLSRGELRTWLESSRNKISAVVQNPYVAPCLGQVHSTIDFRDIINRGKWLLVNVSRDKLKESRRLIGALITALIHNAALARENTPVHRRFFHALLIDELPEFYCPTILTALTGARKFSLSVSLFMQTTNQPPFHENAALMDTIISNCHTRVCFNVGRHDATRLAGDIFSPTGAQPQFQRRLLGIPVEKPNFWGLAVEQEHYAQLLMRQRPAECYITFRGIGDDDPYICRVPHVPDISGDPEKVAALRDHIAHRHYTPLSQVQQEIEQRHQWLRQLAYRAQGKGQTDYTK